MFPDIKKRLKSFVISEKGSISKQSVLAIGAFLTGASVGLVKEVKAGSACGFSACSIDCSVSCASDCVSSGHYNSLASSYNQKTGTVTTNHSHSISNSCGSGYSRDGGDGGIGSSSPTGTNPADAPADTPAGPKSGLSTAPSAPSHTSTPSGSANAADVQGIGSKSSTPNSPGVTPMGGLAKGIADVFSGGTTGAARTGVTQGRSVGSRAPSGSSGSSGSSGGSSGGRGGTSGSSGGSSGGRGGGAAGGGSQKGGASRGGGTSRGGSSGSGHGI